MPYLKYFVFTISVFIKNAGGYIQDISKIKKEGIEVLLFCFHDF